MAKKRRAKKIPTKPTENEELLLQTKTPNLGCELLSPWHAMAGVWKPFLAEHSEWWSRYRHEPIYLLPETVVNQLAQNTPSVGTIHRAKKALIPENDAAAEHAFREACHRYPAGTIGLWDQKAIPFDLPGFSRPAPTDLAELMKKPGGDTLPPEVRPRWSPQLDSQVVNTVRRRLLGYLGFLTFNQQYQAEKESLRAQWLALPDRPKFPICANAHDRPAVPVLAGATLAACDHRLSDDASTFRSALGRFQRKWQLSQMVTWDLAWPQGPLEALPLDAARNFLGPDQLVSTWPAFYEPPSSVDERKKRRSLQGHAASMAGLSGNYPLSSLGGRGEDASSEADAFRLWLMEKTVLSRYGSPHGLTARLMIAFGDILSCSHERIRQLRRLYRPFLPSSERA